jgi:hypothetical protein
VPCLDVSAGQVGDLDRAKRRLDARLDNAARFGCRALLVVRRNMLGRVAVGNRGYGVLAPLALTLARGVIAVADGGLLSQCLRSRLIGRQWTVQPELKLSLTSAMRPVFQEIGLCATWWASHSEAGQLVIPQQYVAA